MVVSSLMLSSLNMRSPCLPVWKLESQRCQSRNGRPNANERCDCRRGGGRNAALALLGVEWFAEGHHRGCHSQVRKARHSS